MAKGKKSNTLKAHRATKGQIRKAHFESGGTVSQWRGRASVQTDRKKENSRSACRERWVDRGEGIESCEETPGPNYSPAPDLDLT